MGAASALLCKSDDVDILNLYHSVVHFLISDGSGVQGGLKGPIQGWGTVMGMW